MGYIPISKDLLLHPTLNEFARRLGELWAIVKKSDGEALSPAEERDALRVASLGVLGTLWNHADAYIESDNSLGVTPEVLAATLNLPPDVLLAIPGKWLKVREDGIVELPRYVERNGLRARDLRRRDAERKRALKNERNRQYRKRQAGRRRDASRKRPAGRAGRSKDASPGTGTGTVPDLNHTGTGPAPNAAPPPAAPHGAPAPRQEASEEATPAIRDLASKGYDPERIAAFLKQRYGVTVDQVRGVVGVEGNGADAPAATSSKKRRKR